jgi:hypothetical protein
VQKLQRLRHGGSVGSTVAIILFVGRQIAFVLLGRAKMLLKCAKDRHGKPIKAVSRRKGGQSPLLLAPNARSGSALGTLGKRESGTARLEEAISAFREALKEFTRERGPLAWATTQNNLGAALRTLGLRIAALERELDDLHRVEETLVAALADV